MYATINMCYIHFALKAYITIVSAQLNVQLYCYSHKVVILTHCIGNSSAGVQHNFLIVFSRITMVFRNKNKKGRFISADTTNALKKRKIFGANILYDSSDNCPSISDVLSESDREQPTDGETLTWSVGRR